MPPISRPNAAVDETRGSPGHAEVGNLADPVLADQDVPGGQVSVHAASARQELHSLRHLPSHVQKVPELQHLRLDDV